MKELLTLGVDIGGTNLRMGTVSSDGKLQSFSRKPSSLLCENTAQRLCEEIRLHIKQSGFEGKISAAAIGLPATISQDRKTVLSAPNLRGFENLELSDRLHKQLGFPVFIERDVNFLLLNDMATHALENERNVLGFYIGTGFGCSIYLNGGFYIGENGAAGELGHIPVPDNDRLCTCGNTGCIETICSGKALEALTAVHFPQTDIKKVFKEHGNKPIIKSFVKRLAVPVAALVNILDCSVCVIGGGVTDMEAFPEDELENAVRSYTRKPYPEKALRLIFTHHNQQSGVFGSGLFAQKQIRKEEKQ